MRARNITAGDGEGWETLAASVASPVAHRFLPPAPPAGRGELILVVDDDESVCELVSTVLQRNGYRVLSCGDGLEAIALFDALSAEVPAVITDVEMPLLGGIELARALLQAFPNIRLIATSRGTWNSRRHPEFPTVLELAHAYLLKPFKPEELLWALHRVLHQAERL